MPYLQQSNSYGCGVFAVMNALNHVNGLKKQLYFKDVRKYEKLLNCCTEYGTEEVPMMRELRKKFYVTYVKDFDKKRMDDWIMRGHQIILLYCTSKENLVYDLGEQRHYTNIMRKKDKMYYGVNFYTSFRFHHNANELFMKYFCGSKRPKWPSAHVMYLRERK